MPGLTPPSRPRCERCQRPLSTCLCRWVVATDNQLPVLLLQHPQEQRQAKGTARLLQLSLRRCRCETAEDFDEATLQQWLHTVPDPRAAVRSLLLYPAAPGEAENRAWSTAHTPAYWQLVVLDGTWRQSRGLLQRHPSLQRLPRLGLSAPPPSRYTIRKAQRPEQRSTLEATCLALAALEGDPARYEPLLRAFDGWVAEASQRQQRGTVILPEPPETRGTGS